MLVGGAAVAWPIAVHPQPVSTKKIGFLCLGNPDPEPFLKALRTRLRDLGYVEGRDIQFEIGSAEGSATRLATLAAELVALKVDVLVAFQTPAASAAKETTKEIPIVMYVADPVRQGFVSSLSRPDELDTNFTDIANWRVEALIVQPSISQRRIAELALHYRFAAAGPQSFVQSGGLIAYGADAEALHGQDAAFIDKILRGAKPGDLPVEMPTKFWLAVNLKTAKALGIRVPQTIMARADEVIE
jgi:ABC-type uncharacterized transport system substrate-binding protein